ncbi:MAG TPA: Ku protein [Candidatus Eisenbacteria bacterium]|nr:Ku protein [Candidatus Eisenbacteria bacterium]
MARSMWKGAIQFGLVTIPVKLYLATESRAGVSFHMLHKDDLSRIQMKVFCPVEEEIIPRTETVKGFEYAPEKYVVITDEDLEKLPLKTVRSIEIEQFVDREEAESQTKFVKQAYYLEPDKVGRKAFTLLKEVLQDKGLTAICKIVIRDREVLAAMDPFDSTMVLSTLYWPDEIRELGELDLPTAEPEVKPAERKMAEQLIAAMTGEFDPAAYHDEYREALMEVIESKIEGRETVSISEAEEPTKLADLMAALQASVKAATSAREGRGEKPVSVAEAKARREARQQAAPEPEKAAPRAATRGRQAERTPPASRAKAAAGTRARPAQRDAAEEEKPARRRKSA